MDMLNNRRNRRRNVGNEMPTPLHGPRTTPVVLPSMEEEGAAAEQTPPETRGAPAAAETTAPPDATDGGGQETPDAAPESKRKSVSRKPFKANAAAAGTLYPTTAYLEIDEDRYIRRTIDAGRYGKPKVTSASAIIRYAVQHLATHMTPEQVVAAIREAAPETSNQGRIRL